MTARLDRLVKQNLDLFESGNLADAEVVCNGRTWKVHKVILRSRCSWFEKAFTDNWQEAKTGRISLEEERPEQVHELLKFIYSGRYIPAPAHKPTCILASVLESNVALWCTADFFLLPDLKADIQECLLDRFAATLAFFHDFSLSLIASKATHHQLVDNKDVIDSLFTVFPKAVSKIYKRPGARELHKLFAVFACGLREHLPAHIMWNLMKAIPEFQQDVSTVLLALHFPQATNEFVVGGLEELCVSETWAIYHGQSLHDRASYKCTGCGKSTSNMISKVKKCYMTLDPFSLGTRKWCNDCACTSIKSLLKTVIGGWPADAPDRGEAR